MPRRAGRSPIGVIFRDPLACAPGGSALPLVQLENGTALEDAAFLDLEIQEHAGDAAPGLVVFQQPEIGLYQRLVESARHLWKRRRNWQVLLASIVEAELYHGAEKYTLSDQRRELLTDFLALYHRIPFDSRCVAHYAKISHHLEIRGEIIGGNDLLIAATALTHGLTLITHNGGEFARVPGLQWEDWA